MSFDEKKYQEYKRKRENEENATGSTVKAQYLQQRREEQSAYNALSSEDKNQYDQYIRQNREAAETRRKNAEILALQTKLERMNRGNTTGVQTKRADSMLRSVLETDGQQSSDTWASVNAAGEAARQAAEALKKEQSAYAVPVQPVSQNGAIGNEAATQEMLSRLQNPEAIQRYKTQLQEEQDWRTAGELDTRTGSTIRMTQAQYDTLRRERPEGFDEAGNWAPDGMPHKILIVSGDNVNTTDPYLTAKAQRTENANRADEIEKLLQLLNTGLVKDTSGLNYGTVQSLLEEAAKGNAENRYAANTGNADGKIYMTQEQYDTLRQEQPENFNEAGEWIADGTRQKINITQEYTTTAEQTEVWSDKLSAAFPVGKSREALDALAEAYPDDATLRYVLQKLEYDDGYQSLLEAYAPAQEEKRDYNYFSNKAGAPNEGGSDWTKEEKGLYRFLYWCYGADKAEEFREKLAPYINKRSSDTATEKVAAWANEHPVLASVGSVGLLVPSAIVGSGSSLFTGWGEDKEVDPYGGGYRVSIIRQALQEGVAKNMGAVDRFFYQTGMSMGDFASLIPMSYIPVVGKYMATSILSLEALQQTTREAKINGATDAQAVGLGIISGAAEYLTENMGFERLMEVFEEAGKAAARGGANATVKEILKRAALEAFPEGAEEFTSEVATDLADYFIMGGSSQWVQRYRELLASGVGRVEAQTKVMGEIQDGIYLSFAGGALSGAVLGAGSTALSIARENRQNSYAAAVQDAMDAIHGTELTEEAVARLQQNPQILSILTSAYNLTTETATAGERLETLTAAQEGAAGLLTTGRGENTAELTARLNEAIRNGGGKNLPSADADMQSLRDNAGITKAEETAKAFNRRFQGPGQYYAKLVLEKAMVGERLTLQDGSTIAGNSNAVEYVNDTVGHELLTTEMTGEQVTDAINAALLEARKDKKKGLVRQQSTVKKTAEEVLDDIAAARAAEKDGAPAQGGAETAYTGTDGEQGQGQEAPANAPVNAAQGETYTAETGSEDTGVELVRKEAARLSTAAGKLLVTGYRGEGAESYIAAFRAYEKAGEVGYTYEQAQGSLEMYSGQIPEEVRRGAWLEGRGKAARAEETKSAAEMRENPKTAEKKKTKTATLKKTETGVKTRQERAEPAPVELEQHTAEKVGKENRLYYGVDSDKLTRPQRVQAEVLDAIARRYGVKIVLESRVDAAEKMKLDAASSSSLGNGEYNRRTGVVTIYKEAAGSAYAYFALHEITHQLSAESPALYAELEGFVVDRLKSSKTYGTQTFEKRVSAVLEGYRKNGSLINLTRGISEASFNAMTAEEQLAAAREGAVEEIVCDSMGTILLNEKTAREFVEGHRTLAEKLRAFLQEFMATVREQLQALAGKAGKSSRPEVWELLGDTATLRSMLYALDRAFAGKTVKGDTGVTYTADGRNVEFTYELVPLQYLTASHTKDLSVNPLYPAELQPRDRGREASKTQVDNIAGHLNPARLGASAEAANGAPIITENLVVVSGNARTIALQSLDAAAMRKYSAWLKENAGSFGFKAEEVQPGMVLVRTITGSLTDEQVSATAQAANISTTANYSATETAKTDAGRITTDLLSLYMTNETDDLSTRDNKAFVYAYMNRVVPVNERNSFMTAEGDISQSGMNRVKLGIFQAAYGSDSLTAALAEELKSEGKSFITQLLKVSPRVVAVRNGIQTGQLHNLDYSADIAAAAEAYRALKRNNKAHDIGGKTNATQQNLFGRSEETELLLFAMDEYSKKPSLFGELLRNLMGAVEGYGSPDQILMPGLEQIPGKVELLRSLLAQAGIATEQMAEGVKRSEETDAITENEYVDNRKKVANMEPVFTSKSDYILPEGKNIKERFVKAIGTEAEINDYIGTINISIAGIAYCVNHGLGKDKINAIPAIRPVLRQGMVVDINHNWKGRGYDTVLLAAPVKINERYGFLGVRVKTTKSHTNYELHEVVFLEENTPADSRISNEAFGSTDVSRERSGGHIKSILQMIIDYYSENEQTVNFTAERIDNLLGRYGAASPRYSKAYAVYISPQDFLSLTTTNATRIFHESSELNAKALQDESQEIFLQYDPETGEVTGHEGRHRMAALYNAGYERVAIAALPEGSEGRYNRQPMEKLQLTGQTFSRGKAPGNVTLNSLIPISQQYKEQLKETFGVKSEINYALDTPEVETGKVLEETERKGAKEALEAALGSGTSWKGDVNALAEKLVQKGIQETAAQLEDSERSSIQGDVVQVLKAAASGLADMGTILDAMAGISKRLLEAGIQRDDTIYNQYRALRELVSGTDNPGVNGGENRIGGMKLALTAEQRARVAEDFGSYESFRLKAAAQGITITRNGYPMTALWAEIVGASKGLLAADTRSTDMPGLLLSTMQTINDRPNVKNGLYDTNTAASRLGIQLLRTALSAMGAKNTTLSRVDNLLKRMQTQYVKRMNEAMQRATQEISSRQKSIREQQVENAKENYLAQEQDLRDRQRKQLALIKENNRLQKQNKRDTDLRRKIRGRIQEQAGALMDMLTSRDKNRLVPYFLQDIIREALSTVNFSRYDLRTGAVEAGKVENAWLRDIGQLPVKNVEQMLDGLQKQELDIVDMMGGTDNPLYSALIEEVRSLSEDLKKNGSSLVNAMSTENLQQLELVLKMLRQGVVAIDQTWANERYKSIAAAAEELQAYAKKQEGKRSWGKLKLADDMLNLQMLDSGSLLAELGPAGESYAQALYKGQEKAFGRIKEATAYTKALYAKNGVTSRQIDKWQKHWKNYKLSGGEISLSDTEIMSLYALSRREQAQLHITNGGVTPVVEKKMGSYEQTATIRLSWADVQQLVAGLSEKQKAIVEGLQEYLSGDVSEWGNEETRKMYLTELFQEKHYWPIRVAGNAKNVSMFAEGSSMLNAVSNQGFTKSILPDAKNSIVLDDCFRTFSRHVTGMASFSGYSAPITDMAKLLNYHEGSDYRVKKSIERLLGGDGVKTVEQLLRDINGLQDATPGSGFMARMLSFWKKASVSGKLRVVIQQPTAVFRALAMVSPKYFATDWQEWKTAIKELARGNTYSVWGRSLKEMQEHSPIAWWKSRGYYDVGTGQSLMAMITGVESAYDKAMNALMKPANYADDVTWALIWRSVKREQAALHPDMDTKSGAFLALVSDRFSDVVNKTQVVDTPLHRSQIMRDKDSGVKMLTAFMAEPIKSYNLLRNQMRAVQTATDATACRAAVLNFLRAGAATALSWTTNAAVLAFHDALKTRDPDDPDKDDLAELFLENLLGGWVSWDKEKQTGWDLVKLLITDPGELRDNFNLLSSIPLVKDVLSIIQGYSSERSDMTLIQNVWDAVTMLYNRIQKISQGKPITTTLYNEVTVMLKAMGDAFGVPASGIISSFEVVANTIAPGGIKKKNPMASATGAYAGIGREIADGNTATAKAITSGILSGKYGYKKTQLEIDRGVGDWLAENDDRIRAIYELRRAGDVKGLTAAYVELTADGYTQDSVTFGVAAYGRDLKKVGAGLAETDPRIQQIVERRAAGDEAGAEALCEQLTAEGYIRETVLYGEEAYTEGLKGDTEDTPALYDYEVLKTATDNLINGTGSLKNVEDIRADLISTSNAKDTEAAVKSKMASEYKPEYIKLYDAGDEKGMAAMESALLEAFGIEAEDMTGWVKADRMTGLRKALEANDDKAAAEKVTELRKLYMQLHEDDREYTERNADSSIISSLTYTYKENYQRAYLAGDKTEMSRIETLLRGLGLRTKSGGGFTAEKFVDWRRDAKKDLA